MKIGYHHANFFSTVGTVCCVIGFEGSFRQFNQATEQTFGYASDELQGRSFLEMVHPDERAATDALLRELSESEEARAFTNRMLHRDGSFHQYIWHATPSLMEFGFYGVAIPAEPCLAQTRDELERYREESVVARERIADLALMLEEQQAAAPADSGEEEEYLFSDGFDLLAIVNLLTEGVVVCDARNTLFMLNASRVMAILGAEISAHDFETLWEQGHQAESPFQPRHVTYNRLGQKPKRLAVFGATLFADDGKTPQDRVILFSDITEQHLMKHHLRGLREDLSLHTRALSEGLLDWKIREDKVRFSASWEALLGLANGEAGQRVSGWHARVHPGDFPQLQGNLNKCLSGKGQAFHILHRLQHKDGTYRWFEVKGEVHRNDKGVAQRFIATFVDVSEQKHLEEALHAAEDAEKALRHERTLCETVFENTPLMIFQQDTQRHVLRANRYASEWFADHHQPFPTSGPFPRGETQVLTQGEAALGLRETLAGQAFLTYKVPFRDNAGKILGIVVFARETE